MLCSLIYVNNVNVLKGNPYTMMRLVSPGSTMWCVQGRDPYLVRLEGRVVRQEVQLSVQQEFHGCNRGQQALPHHWLKRLHTQNNSGTVNNSMETRRLTP